MATETTNAIPTFGEVTGYTRQYLNINNGSVSNWGGPDTYTISATTAVTNCYIIDAAARGGLSGCTMNVFNPTPNLNLYPKYILLCNTSPNGVLLESSSQRLTVLVTQTTTNNIIGVAAIKGPISNSILLGFHIGAKKYFCL